MDYSNVLGWAENLGSSLLTDLESTLVGNAPALLTSLFAGKVPAGIAQTLLADLEAVGLGKLADLGLRVYVREKIKAEDNWINNANAKDGSDASLAAVLSIAMTHAAIETASRDAMLAHALLQWRVAAAENADKANSTPATQQAVKAAQADRDANTVYIRALASLQLVELAGTGEVLPAAPASTLATLEVVNAMLAPVPAKPAPAPVSQPAPAITTTPSEPTTAPEQVATPAEPAAQAAA